MFYYLITISFIILNLYAGFHGHIDILNIFLGVLYSGILTCTIIGDLANIISEYENRR